MPNVLHGANLSNQTKKPRKAHIIFKIEEIKAYTGDLFLFETKSGMYKFSQKCTKGLKNVQNLDARLL